MDKIENSKSAYLFTSMSIPDAAKLQEELNETETMRSGIPEFDKDGLSRLKGLLEQHGIKLSCLDKMWGNGRMQIFTNTLNKELSRCQFAQEAGVDIKTSKRVLQSALIYVVGAIDEIGNLNIQSYDDISILCESELDEMISLAGKKVNNGNIASSLKVNYSLNIVSEDKLISGQTIMDCDLPSTVNKPIGIVFSAAIVSKTVQIGKEAHDSLVADYSLISQPVEINKADYQSQRIGRFFAQDDGFVDMENDSNVEILEQFISQIAIYSVTGNAISGMKKSKSELADITTTGHTSEIIIDNLFIKRKLDGVEITFDLLTPKDSSVPENLSLSNVLI